MARDPRPASDTVLLVEACAHDAWQVAVEFAALAAFAGAKDDPEFLEAIS